MMEVVEYDGRLIEVEVLDEDTEDDPDHAWTCVLECWGTSYRDGQGLPFEMRRDAQGRLLLETEAPVVDVSLAEAVARVAESKLPEGHGWMG